MSMEWTITINEEKQYTEVVTSGIADRDGSLNMAKAISLAMRKRKLTRVLIDHRKIIALSGGTVEIYNRPSEYDQIGMILGIKVAEVVKPEHKQFFNFLETVCLNRGFMFLTFDDKKNALQWLLKP